MVIENSAFFSDTLPFLLLCLIYTLIHFFTSLLPPSFVVVLFVPSVSDLVSLFLFSRNLQSFLITRILELRDR